MEILVVIGVIIVLLAIFTGGGILGWILKGLGEIIGLLVEGWSTIFRFIFIFWILAALIFLLVML